MLLHEITAKNLLSFGPEGMTLPLRPLNVLIGPNGSGKSNFIELIGLLQAAPTNLATPIRAGGGVMAWLWKGQSRADASIEAAVQTRVKQVRHAIELNQVSQRLTVISETLMGDISDEARLYVNTQDLGSPVVMTNTGEERPLATLGRDASILSQLKDATQYPEITELAASYANIRLYREWSFGRLGEIRQPQRADHPNDFLEPDCRNLGLVLNRLDLMPNAKRAIIANLQQLYPGIEDYKVKVEGGTVQMFLSESGFLIPSTRLSDGTLRYLCLLAVLCDPKPPPLVCIEEPELGLHPDIIPTIARLLKEASSRMQLVVTTHSDGLVDELSTDPESIVVCDKVDACTTMKRLNADKLRSWLEEYRLGELWMKGELGGVRW